MIETLCNTLGSQVVIAISSVIGAMAYAGYSIYQKKKTEKGFVYKPLMNVDTIWQSAVAGFGAGIVLGCTWGGVLIAMVTGIGVDKIANKLQVNETQVLNVAQIIGETLDKKDKK